MARYKMNKTAMISAEHFNAAYSVQYGIDKKILSTLSKMEQCTDLIIKPNQDTKQFESLNLTTENSAMVLYTILKPDENLVWN